MSKDESCIDDIRDRVKALISLYEHTADRLRKTSSELEHYKNRESGYLRQIEKLEKEKANLELYKSFKNGVNDEAARERIGKLIASIDSCIDLIRESYD